MAMAMDCCHKEYAEECEIVVCVDAPAPFNCNRYSRLRFGLLASSWLPRPLGIFVWSALHVMLLIVGGPAFWVLSLLTAFFYYVVFLFGFMSIFVCSSFLVVLGLLLAVVDLIVLLLQSIRFCWSLLRLLTCHVPTYKWSRTGGDCSTVQFWENFKSCPVRDMFWIFVPKGVPCMSGSLYKQTKERKLKTWARWCKEVVHMHEAIAL